MGAERHGVQVFLSDITYSKVCQYFSLTFSAAPRIIKNRECHGYGNLPKLVKARPGSQPLGGLIFRSYFRSLRRVIALTINSASIMHSISRSYLVMRHLPIQELRGCRLCVVAFPATPILYQTIATYVNDFRKTARKQGKADGQV